jgi:peroxiredoxin
MVYEYWSSTAQGLALSTQDSALEVAMPLQVGDTAPDFSLRDGTGRGTVSLSDFAGRPVVLAFYALAFTGG